MIFLTKFSSLPLELMKIKTWRTHMLTIVWKWQHFCLSPYDCFTTASIGPLTAPCVSYPDDCGTWAKGKCHHFEEILISACENYSMQLTQWWKCTQNNISVPVIMTALIVLGFAQYRPRFATLHVYYCYSGNDSGAIVAHHWNGNVLPPNMENYCADKMTTFPCHWLWNIYYGLWHVYHW